MERGIQNFWASSLKRGEYSTSLTEKKSNNYGYVCYKRTPMEYWLRLIWIFLSLMQEPVCLCPFLSYSITKPTTTLFGEILAVVWLIIPVVSNGEEAPTFGGTILPPTSVILCLRIIATFLPNIGKYSPVDTEEFRRIPEDSSHSLSNSSLWQQWRSNNMHFIKSFIPFCYDIKPIKNY